MEKPIGKLKHEQQMPTGCQLVEIVLAKLLQRPQLCENFQTLVSLSANLTII
jgi:hypothetical protein